MISFKHEGDFRKLKGFLERSKEVVGVGLLDKYGRAGVEALKKATPVETGKTAESWSYEIVRKRGQISIVWKNGNIQNGVPIAVILQYGHATKNGGWVQGRDYINQALHPLFDKIANEAWKEVIK